MKLKKLGQWLLTAGLSLGVIVVRLAFITLGAVLMYVGATAFLPGFVSNLPECSSGEQVFFYTISVAAFICGFLFFLKNIVSSNKNLTEFTW
jgi:hypothetical protein